MTDRDRDLQERDDYEAMMREDEDRILYRNADGTTTVVVPTNDARVFRPAD